VQCPTCGSQAARRSKRNGLERLFSALDYFPYRCRKCWERFWQRESKWNAPDGSVPHVRAESRRRRALATRREIIIYTVALALFLLATSFLAYER
jgi:DNA-directed RNA polymerase subunit RPC12/RpoP